MTPDAARALAWLRNARNPVTAVTMFCPGQPSHVVLSVHPIGPRWLIWRRPGRRARTAERGGGFGSIAEDAYFAAPGEAPVFLDGTGYPIGCRCTGRYAEKRHDDVLRDAVSRWRQGDPPVRVVLT